MCAHCKYNVPNVDITHLINLLLSSTCICLDFDCLRNFAAACGQLTCTMTSPMCVCVKEYFKNRNVQRSPAQRVAERVANLSGVRSSVNFPVPIVTK